MRVMVKFTFPTQESNALIENRSIGQTLRTIMGNIQPEAAYFCHVDGKRGGYLVANMEEGSELVSKLEPFFLELGAQIETFPVMTMEELGAGMQNLRQTEKGSN
jgi:hypothetical protein